MTPQVRANQFVMYKSGPASNPFMHIARSQIAIMGLVTSNSITTKVCLMVQLSTVAAQKGECQAQLVANVRTVVSLMG